MNVNSFQYYLTAKYKHRSLAIFVTWDGGMRHNILGSDELMVLSKDESKQEFKKLFVRMKYAKENKDAEV